MYKHKYLYSLYPTICFICSKIANYLTMIWAQPNCNGAVCKSFFFFSQLILFFREMRSFILKLNFQVNLSEYFMRKWKFPFILLNLFSYTSKQVCIYWLYFELRSHRYSIFRNSLMECQKRTKNPNLHEKSD